MLALHQLQHLGNQWPSLLLNLNLNLSQGPLLLLLHLEPPPSKRKWLLSHSQSPRLSPSQSQLPSPSQRQLQEVLLLCLKDALFRISRTLRTSTT